MNNQNLVRGLFLMAVALVFGVAASRLPIGQLSRSGPGLFPSILSSFLFLIGLIMVVRARYLESVPLSYNYKNLAIVVLALGGFAFISEHINMIAGIVFLVFCSTFAGTSYSVVRNLKISAGLITIAFALKYLLGLGLPLI